MSGKIKRERWRETERHTDTERHREIDWRWYALKPRWSMLSWVVGDTSSEPFDLIHGRQS